MTPALAALKKKHNFSHCRPILGRFNWWSRTDYRGNWWWKNQCEDIPWCPQQKYSRNIVDDPTRCDFILPSFVQRGDLAITIGTRRQKFRRWLATCVKSWKQNTVKNIKSFSTSWKFARKNGKKWRDRKRLVWIFIGGRDTGFYKRE